MKTTNKDKRTSVAVFITLIATVIIFSALSIVFFEMYKVTSADIAYPDIVPRVLYYAMELSMVLMYTVPFAVIAYTVVNLPKKNVWLSLVLFYILYIIFIVLTIVIEESTDSSYSYMFHDFSMFLSLILGVYGLNFAVVALLSLASVFGAFVCHSNKKAPLFVLGGALVCPMALQIFELMFRFITAEAFEVVDFGNFGIDIGVTVLESGVVPFLIGILIFKLLNKITRRKTA